MQDPIYDAPDTGHITDLFSREESSQAQTRAEQKKVTPELHTSEFDLAVALACCGYGQPSLKPVGHNRHGNLNVEFVFVLRPDDTPRALEDRFHNAGFTAEISLVQSTNRALRKRINRMSKELEQSSEPPATVISAVITTV